MSRLDSLADVRKPELERVVLAEMPNVISMAQYAKEKAHSVNDLVKEVHNGSFEWYGFTIAEEDEPYKIVDIGLGDNDQNQRAYTRIDSVEIKEFQESLPAGQLINGWIHSHADLGLKQFSGTDDRNHQTVLDYVSTKLRIPVEKKEILVENLGFADINDYQNEDLMGGNVVILADKPITHARMFDTVMGTAMAAVVIGDEGWNEQELHYKTKEMLGGTEKRYKLKTNIVLFDDGRQFDNDHREMLRTEVEEKISPPKFNYVNFGWQSRWNPFRQNNLFGSEGGGGMYTGHGGKDKK